MPKGETFGRVLELCEMFKHGTVTHRMLQDRWGISRYAAVTWIDRASRHLPIVEAGLDYCNGIGRPSKLYGLME